MCRQAKKVLVVEDDDDIRDALCLMLECAGFRAAGAANGLEAIELLRNDPEFRVIFLDLMMPVMNGWQFRAEQTQDPALSAVPVVVLSADSGLEQKAARLNVDGFLQKPARYEELIGVLERLG